MTRARRHSTTLRTTIGILKSALAVLSAAAAISPASLSAQTYKVLHTFSGGADGATPLAGLSMDRAGNLYGTAFYGGTLDGDCQYAGCGTAFKLTPVGSNWIFGTLYSFLGQNDGANPEARAMVGPNGSLYGSTRRGSIVNLRPPPNRPPSAFSSWINNTLYLFPGDGSGGAFPEGDLAFDQAGNIYGSVDAGGGGNCYEGCGLVYKLTPSGSGYTESVIYAFQGAPDGGGPNGVVFGPDGNLYGTTFNGGTNGQGTVFRLVPSGGGWTEQVLHSFQYNDGINPGGGVIFDAAGNIYGSTTTGPGYSGTIFQLSPASGFKYTVLYSIPTTYEGGPAAQLTMDTAGNLYGTINGYCVYCWGGVFKLTSGSGGWTFTSLHDFNGSDGGHPYSNLVFDSKGNLYGTASNGGPYNGNCQYQSCGVVFEITP